MQMSTILVGVVKAEGQIAAANYHLNEASLLSNSSKRTPRLREGIAISPHLPNIRRLWEIREIRSENSASFGAHHAELGGKGYCYILHLVVDLCKCVFTDASSPCGRCQGRTDCGPKLPPPKICEPSTPRAELICHLLEFSASAGQPILTPPVEQAS